MIPVGDHKVLMAIVSAPGILLPLRNAHLGLVARISLQPLGKFLPQTKAKAPH